MAGEENQSNVPAVTSSQGQEKTPCMALDHKGESSSRTTTTTTSVLASDCQLSLVTYDHRHKQVFIYFLDDPRSTCLVSMFNIFQLLIYFFLCAVFSFPTTSAK
jgi:hypothetical protein